MTSKRSPLRKIKRMKREQLKKNAVKVAEKLIAGFLPDIDSKKKEKLLRKVYKKIKEYKPKPIKGGIATGARTLFSIKVIPSAQDLKHEVFHEIFRSYPISKLKTGMKKFAIEEILAYAVHFEFIKPHIFNASFSTSGVKNFARESDKIWEQIINDPANYIDYEIEELGFYLNIIASYFQALKERGGYLFYIELANGKKPSDALKKILEET